MKEYKEKRRKDRSDRATVDKVLDKKTLKILEKLQARKRVMNLRGSLCTGKESNVYLAEASTDLRSKFVKNKHVVEPQNELSDEMVPVAIKIFKTSIMPFKDRERYIRSEKRFQTFCTSNPRKLIKLWAEKEVRNLRRLNKACVPSPEPIYLKNNVLIMRLIGTYDAPAPRLRDAVINDLEGCYMQCVNIIRNMYRDAGLIHADLSEFNLLYHEDVVYVIDVGQSVETGHENAQRFLIMDINNLNSFFSKKGVNVIRGNDLFEDVTGSVIPAYLRSMDIGSDVFIPSRVSEVGNAEDLEMFKVDRKNTETVDLVSESSYEDDVFCDGVEDRIDPREERKKNKKMVKELNKVRRASRISNKEKKKIFSKYVGMKRRR